MDPPSGSVSLPPQQGAPAAASIAATDAVAAPAAVESLPSPVSATFKPGWQVRDVTILKFGGILVYLKYWTLHLRPLMVYPKVLYRSICPECETWLSSLRPTVACFQDTGAMRSLSAFQTVSSCWLVTVQNVLFNHSRGRHFHRELQESGAIYVSLRASKPVLAFEKVQIPSKPETVTDPFHRSASTKMYHAISYNLLNPKP